jgi:hypothetical protein
MGPAIYHVVDEEDLLKLIGKNPTEIYPSISFPVSVESLEKYM